MLGEFDLHRWRAMLAEACTTAGYPGHVTIPDEHRFPAAVVRNPREVLYNNTYGPAGVQVTIPVELRVNRARPGDAQKALDGALASVPRHIQALATERPRVTFKVARAGTYRPVDVGEQKALTVELTVEIHA